MGGGDPAPAIYIPLMAARSRMLTVRTLSYHLREWGTPGAPCLIMVHGSRDFGASFQFVVDALKGDWHVPAPDWRGHGRSSWTPGSYWQADFVADLDALLDEVAPDRPFVLVGHSMGGNIASLYAAMNPTRVSHLVMLDSMGELLDRVTVDPHEVLKRSLMARKTPPARVYADVADFAGRLLRHNRRLDPARALFLASEWLVPVPGGIVRGGDPSFVRGMPSLHNTAEWAGLWQRITAPVLYVPSSDVRANSPLNDAAELGRRLDAFADLRRVDAPNTGHNVHHDAAAFVASLVERHVLGELPARTKRDR